MSLTATPTTPTTTFASVSFASDTSVPETASTVHMPTNLADGKYTPFAIWEMYPAKTSTYSDVFTLPPGLAIYVCNGQTDTGYNLGSCIPTPRTYTFSENLSGGNRLAVGFGAIAAALIL
ncbi:hypothetical protein CKK34_4816 [Yarrowia sp. E02]|nr:hypothetical protein CKK34_4816 [Yarrowia sp. E02]